MKFDINFQYRIRYWPVRKVNARHANGSARATVTVPRADPADAPVVARVSNPDGTRHHGSPKRFCPMPDGSPREIRFFRGRHYVEWGSAESWKAAVSGAGVESTLLSHAYPYRGGNAPVTTIAELLVASRGKGGEGEINRYEDDGGASVAASLDEWSARCLVVGDSVFEETAEPVLKIHFGRAYVASSPLGDPHLRDNASVGSTFHESLTDAETLRSRMGEGGWPVILDVRQEAFGFDGATYDTVTAARGLVDYAGPHAMAFDRDVLDAYCALRDEIPAADGRVTPGLVSALEAIAYRSPCVAGRLDELASWHEPKGGHGNSWNMITRRAHGRHHASNEVFHPRTQAILDRWNERFRASHWTQGACAPVEASGHKARSLLSRHQVSMACMNAGIDPTPVIEQVGEGCEVHASGEFLQPGECNAIASVHQDGQVTFWTGESSANAAVLASVSAADLARRHREAVIEWEHGEGAMGMKP